MITTDGYYNRFLPARDQPGAITRRLLRESLGLPVAWLADRWGLPEEEVAGWEHAPKMPEAQWRDLYALYLERNRLADKVARSHCFNAVPMPATESPDGMPIGWHHSIALRVWQSMAAGDLDWTDAVPDPSAA